MTAVDMEIATSLLASVHAIRILSSTLDLAASSWNVLEGVMNQLANAIGMMASASAKSASQVRNAHKTNGALQTNRALLKPTGGQSGISPVGLRVQKAS
jgi:hypothetical protein